MYRQYRFHFGTSTSFPPGVKWILIITTIIFALQLFSNHRLTDFFALYSYFSGFFMPWQPVSYMFLHGSPLHFLFNMFMVWMLGRQFEEQLGTKRFLQLYFICGIGTGLIEPLFLNKVIGASAAVYGLMVAFAYFWPNAVIYVFFILPMRVKTAVIIFLGIELLLSIGASSQIAHSAHLLGALISFIFLQINYNRYDLFQGRFHSIKQKLDDWADSFQKSKGPKATVIEKDKWTEDKVDELLEKVSRYGIDSLTTKEREFLDRIGSQKKN